MSEEIVTVKETKTDVPANTETQEVTETVSEEIIKEVNNEIEKVEQEKLDAAKQEGKAEVSNDIEALKAEIAEVKAKNEAAERKRQEEAEAAKLRAELEAEKAKLEQPIKKRVVMPQDNPVKQEAPEPAPVPQLNTEQQWAEFDKTFRGISVTAKKQ